MVSCRCGATRAGVASLVGAALASIALSPTAAGAGPSQPIEVDGELDYDTVAPGTVVESVAGNSVTLTFSPEGGPFTATASLALVHDVPSRGCRFDSTHQWEVSGELRPGTLQFAGDYTELRDETVGVCDGFSFVRTFDPDVGPFIADLDPLTGTITSRIAPLGFVLTTDPSALASLVPEQPPPPATNAFTTILDSIRSRHDPITASGTASGVTSDASIVTNDFTLEFNPLGGPSTVMGEVGVRTDQTLDDGRTCSWITRQVIEGSGDFDAATEIVTGVFGTTTDRDVLECEFETTFDAPPPGSGSYSLSIDLVAGMATGEIAGFPLNLAFDPSLVPPAPGPQFRVELLDYALDDDVLRVGIEWAVPWPPDEVDSLLVGGEVTTPDGLIVFGVSLDGDVASTFMDPDGPYSATVTDDGHAVLEVRHPGLTGAVGSPIRITTWHAATPDDAGTLLGTFSDEIDPVGSPLGPARPILTLPFDLPSFWETGQLPGAELPDEPVEPGVPVDEAPAETEAAAPQGETAASESPGAGGGFPWPVVVIPIVGLGTVALFWWRRRRGTTEAGPGGLVVHVVDTEGQALPGADVRVTGFPEGVTDDAGMASFPNVAPGSYRMRVALEGFSTVEHQAVVVIAGRTATIEVRLSTAVEEVITVTAESPLLDERRIQGLPTVTGEELDKIPTIRDPLDLVGRDSGAVPDNRPPEHDPGPLPEEIEETLDVGETRSPESPPIAPTPEHPVPEPVAVTPSFVPSDDETSFPLHAPVQPGGELSYVEALRVEQAALAKYRSDPAYYERAVRQRRAEADAEVQAIYTESMALSQQQGESFDGAPFVQAATEARDRLTEDLADLEQLRDDAAFGQRRFLAIEDELDRHAAPVVDELDGPRITLRRSRSGQPIESLVGDQEFYPMVEIPNSETPPDRHITIQVTSQRWYKDEEEPAVSDSEPVELELVGLRNGNWLYSTSAPVTLRDPHPSGLRDRLGVDFDNGDEVVFEHLGSEFRLHAWDSPTKQWDGEVRVLLEDLEKQYTAARERILRIASVTGFDDELEEVNEMLARAREQIVDVELPDGERAVLLDEFDVLAGEARQRLVVIHNDADERARALADIDRRLGFVEAGLVSVNRDALVQDRAMRGRMYANLAMNPNQDVNEAIARTERNIENAQLETFTAGMKGVGIGFGQAIADVLLFPAVYGIVVGEDFVTGRRMSAFERIQTAFFMVVFSLIFIRLASVAAGAKVRVSGPAPRRPGSMPGRAHRRGGDNNVGHTGYRPRAGPAGGSNMVRRPVGPGRGRPGRGQKPPLDEVLPPVENVRPPTGPAMTDTQRVSAPTPADLRAPTYQPGKRVPSGAETPIPPEGIVYSSPPARSTVGYYRATRRHELSAGISKQSEKVNCWPTTTGDAARAAGRGELTSDVLTDVARNTRVEATYKDPTTGQMRTERLAAYADEGGPSGDGMWVHGQVPVLQKVGAQATQISVQHPNQFVALGAYARQPGRSVVLDIVNTTGGGHSIRLLGVRNQGGRLVATVADPGPGLAFDVRAIDLFQQAHSATMVHWSP